MFQKNLALTSIVLFFLTLVPCGAQQMNGSPFIPGKDANIDMFLGSWKESMPRHTHGTLVERDILTTGDPIKPPVRGAVLTYVNRFTHATLYPGSSTTPTTLKNEQEIFYIISGNGTISASGTTADLFTGIAVLMPGELEFTMENTGTEPMTMYLVAEPYEKGFRLNKEMLIVNENTKPIDSSNAHWIGVVKGLFNTSHGLGTLESILTCSFTPMTFFHPHSHVPGCEEVWTTITDELYVLIGKQIRLQLPGTGYMIPPDGLTPHANFNVSDHTVKMFYFARYGDHDLRE